MMTSESIAVIADQIAKGVDAKRCNHRLVCSVVTFFYIRHMDAAAFTVSVSIGAISAEYLELIDALKPREKRKAIRKKIRDFREYVRGMEDVMEDSDNDN